MYQLLDNAVHALNLRPFDVLQLTPGMPPHIPARTQRRGREAAVRHTSEFAGFVLVKSNILKSQLATKLTIYNDYRADFREFVRGTLESSRPFVLVKFTILNIQL